MCAIKKKCVLILVYVSSNWYIILVYMCAIKTHTRIYVCYKKKMCAHTGIYGIYVPKPKGLLYMCPYATLYATLCYFICYYICVLILL